MGMVDCPCTPSAVVADGVALGDETAMVLAAAEAAWRRRA